MSMGGLRPPLLHLATLLVELSWLAALAAALGGGVGWGGLIGVGLGLLLWNRWLFGLAAWEGPLGRAGSLGSGLLGIALLLQAAAPGSGLLPAPALWWEALAGLPFVLARAAPLSVALLIGGLLYVRVMATVFGPLSRWALWRRLQGAALLLLAALFVATARDIALAPVPFLLLFAAGPLALALARASDLSALPGASPLPFTGRWLGALTGAVGGTMLGALLLVALLPGQTTRLLRRLLGLVAQAILGIYILIAQAMAWLLLPLLERLLADVEIAPLPTPTPLPTPEGGLLAPAALPGMAGGAPSFSLLPLCLVLGIVVAALFLGRFLARRRRPGPAADASVPTDYGALPMEDPVGWLRLRAGELRARLTRGARGSIGVETVAELYQNLQLFGERAGLPRPSDDTPLEYLDPLCQRYPERCADFRALTDAYVATHYGEQALTRGEIEQLQGAWRRISEQVGEG